MSSRPRPSRPTIYDVAREAGVSKSLVSLVLNDSELVSEPKRAAVKAAIERLGYRPSRAAANLAADRTYTVGMVIDDFENPWFVEILAGLRDQRARHRKLAKWTAPIWLYVSATGVVVYLMLYHG